ncbi:neuronal acetylcholine receptor subunit alpha-10-like [Pocillopora verrucosa]|uniref:neuronal acetylcholine receptor subunit alpha-10-like n=1 Tax=Pocillopora verrucosa TaxID=203993 RepID=UPI00279758FC|nr:neuronal acetylcholine receptor subunit alpha-10-like [Pocillopora verrucosa]
MNSFTSRSLVLVALISFVTITTTKGLTPEERLITNLLANYTKEARPVKDPRQKVVVTFGFELVQLVNVDVRNQMITTNVWVRQIWDNELLTWDPRDYDQIQTVRLDASLVWIPDIVLYNSADNEFSGGTDKYKTPVILSSNGSCSWFCPASFTSTCPIDVQYFPFDRQKCVLKFGSWTYEVIDLDMKEENGSSQSQYIQSAEWNLYGIKKQRNAKKYTCCKHKLADISITIIMDRKPLFYLFNLVIPCLIILSMILLGFFLPPESGERITLSITVLLANAVFLQLVGESLPRNSETVPLLGKFYITIMAEISISLMLTCWVLNIHYHGSGNSVKAVPLWARIIVLQWLGYILCVGKPDGSSPDIPNTDLRYHQDDSKRRGVPFALDWETTFAPAANCHCTRCINARGTHYNGERSPDESKLIEVRYTRDSSPVDFPETRREKLPREPKLPEEISVLANSVKEREKVEKNQQDWKYFAMVMDRFFFWFYSMTILVSTLTIFLSRSDEEIGT